MLESAIAASMVLEPPEKSIGYELSADAAAVLGPLVANDAEALELV